MIMLKSPSPSRYVHLLHKQRIISHLSHLLLINYLQVGKKNKGYFFVVVVVGGGGGGGVFFYKELDIYISQQLN